MFFFCFFGCACGIGGGRTGGTTFLAEGAGKSATDDMKNVAFYAREMELEKHMYIFYQKHVNMQTSKQISK